MGTSAQNLRFVRPSVKCREVTHQKIMSADLTPKDMERARFAFDIYDFEGKARMDLFYLGDVLRGLNCSPTLAKIEALGGTKKKGEKFITLGVLSNLLRDEKST